MYQRCAVCRMHCIIYCSKAYYGHNICFKRVLCFTLYLFFFLCSLSDHKPVIEIPHCENSEIIVRVYEMPYFPIGFWSRLISRLLEVSSFMLQGRGKTVRLKYSHWNLSNQNKQEKRKKRTLTYKMVWTAKTVFLKENSVVVCFMHLNLWELKTSVCVLLLL